jgi:hypothetical protein
MTTRAHVRATAANILHNHFDTEASDAGLRSLDLASTGARGSASHDASAVSRADRVKTREKLGETNTHQRVRETLKRLTPRHVDLLSLAYGIRLRTRDTEDSKNRRAVRTDERGWRVRFAELYGQDGLVVLASPLAHRLFAEHRREPQKTVTHKTAVMHINGASIPVENITLVMELPGAPSVVANVAEVGLIEWLLGAGKTQAGAILNDAKLHLDEALDAFAVEHSITDRHDTQTPRHRSSEKTRSRILASFPENGHIIGG